MKLHIFKPATVIKYTAETETRDCRQINASTVKNALTCIAMCLFALQNPVWAQDYNPPPSHTRSLFAPYTVKSPVIDGKVDDEPWQDAAVASDFWLSAEQRLPTDRTEVLILRDEQHLYFAFHCYDSQPESIVADRTRRDAGLGNDDKVSVELDSFHNYRTISTYSVNAQGTQNDEISGGRARKIEWKGDWKGAAVRTEYGWTAEIAIPFSILNYHSESRNFGINFLRYQNRTDELSRWSDVTLQNKREKMGVLSGLELPDISKQQPWTFMPYVLAGVNLLNIDGEARNRLAYAGADIRYEPRPNVTGVVSLYPDFNQLEAQVTDIDFSYTEKFRTDPRPFFQEGSAYFGSDRSYFYSNRVPNFYVGGKSFAQIGKIATGGLLTWAPDERWDGVLRVVNQIDALHSAGAMLVATHREELDNQLAVIQLDGREPGGLFYDLDVAYSNTEKKDFDTGGAARGSIGWQYDYWTVEGSSDYYDKEYFPADGLFKDDRYGTKSLNASAGYYRLLAPGQGLFREISGSVSLTGRDTMDGRRQNHGIWIDGSVELHQQIKVLLSYYDAHYRPVGDERGEFSDTLNHDHYWATNLDFNTRSNIYGYGVYYADGILGGGDYQYITGYLWVKPTINTSFKVSSEQLENFGTFNQTIVNLGWDITNQDGIVARYIDSEGDGYIRVAYRHTPRAGVDYFAVFDENPFTDTQFSVKAVWSLRR